MTDRRTRSLYLAVDTETSGLSEKDCLLEIAAMPLDSSLHPRDVPPFHELVRPVPGVQIGPKALEINGHTWALDPKSAKYRTAVDPAKLRGLLDAYLKKYYGVGTGWIVLTGWNVAFDAAFIGRLYASEPPGKPFHYHRLDLMAICRYLDCRAGRTRKSYRLESMADGYGLTGTTSGKAHTALADCEMMLQVLAAVEQDSGE